MTKTPQELCKPYFPAYIKCGKQKINIFEDAAIRSDFFNVLRKDLTDFCVLEELLEQHTGKGIDSFLKHHSQLRGDKIKTAIDKLAKAISTIEKGQLQPCALPYLDLTSGRVIEPVIKENGSKHYYNNGEIVSCRDLISQFQDKELIASFNRHGFHFVDPHPYTDEQKWLMGINEDTGYGSEL